MSLMKQELLESPQIIERQIKNKEFKELALKLENLKLPDLFLTVARGSSDNAGQYLSYLLMKILGVPSCSIPLSLNTVYQTKWNLKNSLTLAISQSGGSPDLKISVENLKKAGTKTLALVNTTPSPLSEISDLSLNIGAGAENSVAATKSFIATLSAGIFLFNNAYFKDRELGTAFLNLPQTLSEAENLNWDKALELLKDAQRLYVVGRGLGLYIAQEAALKCKETCLLQGEAFSAAEVQHGPMALINPNQIVIFLAPPDEFQAEVLDLAEKFKNLGAKVLVAADKKIKNRDLDLIDARHSYLQGLSSIYSFYSMAEKLSALRGINTDNPPNLNKITKTN